ncbi:MAG TPA: PEGA domain-containing protein [Pyrinomonadaceae bacterium]|nr:PEGA domain-containing protein [Pyrinomonadaceae bacterium]
MTTQLKPILLLAVGLLLTAHAASAQSQSTAALRVKTDTVDVEVWLDGEPVGRTPLTLKNLPTGKRRIALLKDGYEDHLQEVEVSPGRSNSVFVVMKPWSVKLPALPVEFRVVDEGRRSKWVGTLIVSAEALDYKSDNGAHRFSIPITTIKSVVRALSPVVGGMPQFKSPNSKEVMAIRITAAGGSYNFIAFKENRKDPFEVANETTRELYDVVYRLWFATLTPTQKSKD